MRKYFSNTHCHSIIQSFKIQSLDLKDVRAKKSLGQHFLRDLDAAQKIADLMSGHGNYTQVLEIGPGMGVLTQFLLQHPEYQTDVVELDTESVEYLNVHYPELKGRIHSADFLHLNLEKFFGGKKFGVVGNFPYNISSQILFKVLDYKDLVPEVAGMFQKEVAVRIDRKSTRLNSSHPSISRMPSSA